MERNLLAREELQNKGSARESESFLTPDRKNFAVTV
jgi:hypothetical protein